MSENGERAACAKCGHSLAVQSVEACSNFRCEDFPHPVGIVWNRDWDKAFPELPLFQGRRWGNWRLDTERLRLTIPSGSSTYYVDLASITDSASMLDWIFQIEHKGRITDKDLVDLLIALDDIFRPQTNLCSGSLSGTSGKTIDPTTLISDKVKQG